MKRFFMRHQSACTVVVSALLLSACSKNEPPAALQPAAPSAAESAPVEVKTGTTAPDFGGVTKVSREVEAVGGTQELAVLSALQMAVSQINGVRVASQMQAVRADFQSNLNGRSTGTASAEALVQKLVAASQGAVTGFEILSQEQIDQVDEEVIARVRASDGGFSYSASASSERQSTAQLQQSASVQLGGDSAKVSGSYAGSTSSKDAASVDMKRGPSSYESDQTYKKMRSYWKVRARVEVAQYKAPEEKGRPKIVVASPKTLAATYTVGDSREPSAEVARAVRARLSEALTQTKRFIVLDREFGSELDAEIEHINSGKVRLQDTARIGQQLAADLILVPTIDRFEYPKSVRKLKMSDRELVSYSGGGRITLRLINMATGEVVLSESFDHALASADPSTMPRVIDGKNMAAQMMDSLSAQMGQSIVTQIFPISVVAMDGASVVLSQGGDAVKVGQRWEAVYLGSELKDPQTGLSLGRNETVLGAVRIDRVSTQTAYGALENGASLGDRPFKPGVIELRKRMPSADTEPTAAVGAAAGLGGVQAASPAPQAQTAAQPVAAGQARPAAAPRTGARHSTVTDTPRVPAAAAEKDDKW